MKKVYTLGHSTRSFQDLVKVLKHYRTEVLIDVRHFPRSRHNPQFNKENLEDELPKNGINYIWVERLGGFRKGGYKKYTKTKEFKEGLKELEKIINKTDCAIMCAELLWFKCHRRYIADSLKRKGYKVMHIYDEKKAGGHRITKKRKIKCD